MRKQPFLAAAGCVAVLLALLVEYTVPKLDVARPRRLPVEDFPTRIGAWHGGDLQAVDADVQKKLSTAKIVDRVYRDDLGNAIDLTLVTASDSDHIHDPMLCFPAQGWRLSNERSQKVGSQSVQVMDAQNGGQHLTVLYWLTGYYEPRPPTNPLMRSLGALRNRLIGRREGMSLFVRLVGPDGGISDQTMARFATDLQPPLDSLVDAGRTAQERQDRGPLRQAERL